MAGLRIGLVGAGYIAGIHSAAYRAVGATLPDIGGPVELALVADQDLNRARSLAHAWGWRATSADWRDVVTSDAVDIVDISVPNALHAEIAAEALKNGKHVVCEKPLAPDLEQANKMVSAAAASKGLAQVCFYYRCWPAIQWAKKQIAAGRIGEIQHVRAWMLQEYAANPSHPLGWRSDPKEAGGGAIGDLGSHVFDLAQYLAGDINRVCALTRQTVDRSPAAPVQDMLATLVEFRHGATGVIEASWAMRGHRCDLGFDICGSAGAIRFTWERSNEIEIYATSGTEGLSRVLVGPEMPGAEPFGGVQGQGLGYRDAFTIGLSKLVRAVHAGAPDISPSFADGLKAVKLVAATVESAASSRWVDVDPGSDAAEERRS